MKSKKDPNARITRWRLKLAEYEYDVIYRKETLNCVADSLSRNPVLVITRSKNTGEKPQPGKYVFIRKYKKQKTPKSSIIIEELTEKGEASTNDNEPANLVNKTLETTNLDLQTCLK